jgi:hypothetical protein
MCRDNRVFGMFEPHRVAYVPAVVRAVHTCADNHADKPDSHADFCSINITHVCADSIANLVANGRPIKRAHALTDRVTHDGVQRS